MSPAKDTAAVGGAEIDLHLAVAQFLDWCLLPPAFWTTFPAGWDVMGRARAGKLYACGLKAGVPDILIFYNGFTLAIELKTAKGKTSAVQQMTQERLTKVGVFVHTCRDVEDVEYILKMRGLPLRGSLQPTVKERTEDENPVHGHDRGHDPAHRNARECARAEPDR